jgi:protein-disulfide isomerase
MHSRLDGGGPRDDTKETLMTDTPTKNVFAPIQYTLELLATVGIVIVCAIVISQFISGGTPLSSNARAASKRTQLSVPQALLPLTDGALEGKSDAPVAIIEYSDFQCPFCGTFARDTLPELKAKYVTTGRVLMAFRNFPLARIHANALTAAVGAECARRQDQFWPMHDRLFGQQSKLSKDEVRAIAETLRLNMKQFDECTFATADGHVNQDVSAGKSLGIGGTPTFFVGMQVTPGKLKVTKVMTGAQTMEQLDAVLDDLLAHASIKSN